MPKVLNLDKIGEKEQRELHLAGKVYVVKEMSVEDFIESSKMAEQVSDETSFAVQMEVSVKLIKRSIPDIEDTVLKSLSLEQLAAVSKFVRGEEVGEAEAQEGGEGNV